MVSMGSLAALCLAALLAQVSGHGMLWDPPNRSSLWRFGIPAPINYNDNQNWCGGFDAQWHENDGNCGLCGDNFADPVPRDNEAGGKYGAGYITGSYRAGANITITIRLTAAHMGHFTFSLCNMDLAGETEGCFQPLLLSSGAERLEEVQEARLYELELSLPPGLTCERCVLRWVYETANVWGYCEDGSWAIGCGPQEFYLSCSDITIT